MLYSVLCVRQCSPCYRFPDGTGPVGTAQSTKIWPGMGTARAGDRRAHAGTARGSGTCLGRHLGPRHGTGTARLEQWHDGGPVTPNGYFNPPEVQPTTPTPPACIYKRSPRVELNPNPNFPFPIPTAPQPLSSSHRLIRSDPLRPPLRLPRSPSSLRPPTAGQGHH